MEKDRQSRRWIVVINNAFFDDDDKDEIDINNTELPLKLDYYNLSHQKRDDNKHLFDFKYVTYEDEKTKEQFVVERPYFKNLESLHEYYKNLDDIKYAVYNYEQGNEKQTKHIQSFVIFKFGKRFETMKNYFPTAYLKRPDGNNAENRNYCMKSETQIAGPFEVGTFAEEKQRTDYDNFFAFLEQKASNKTIRQHFPMLFAKHFPQIKKMRQDILT
jgi:hypothetical protein